MNSFSHNVSFYLYNFVILTTSLLTKSLKYLKMYIVGEPLYERYI